MQYKLEDEDTLMASNYVSRWLRAMQCDARLTFADKGFAGALAVFATHETGRDCYPSNLRLSLMGNVTGRSITRYRNKLVATGWIAIVRDGRGREATEVELTFPDASCYDLSLLTRKLDDDETRQDCQVKPDTAVRFQNANMTNLSVQTRQDCQVKHDTGVTPPTHGPTQEPTQRERAGAQSQHAAHEQAREADALPSPSEQIGQGQTSEVVTAEIVEVTRAVEAPPVTEQALSGEGHAKASDTPPTMGQLPEDMQRLRDELRAANARDAAADRQTTQTPEPDVYLDALRKLVSEDHKLLWRSASAWHQIIHTARGDGWTVEQLTDAVHWCLVHYQHGRKPWRPSWLLTDVGRFNESNARVLGKADAVRQCAAIEATSHLGQGKLTRMERLRKVDM